LVTGLQQCLPHGLGGVKSFIYLEHLEQYWPRSEDCSC
jgi:hypothetical protein